MAKKIPRNSKEHQSNRVMNSRRHVVRQQSDLSLPACAVKVHEDVRILHANVEMDVYMNASVLYLRP